MDYSKYKRHQFTCATCGKLFMSHHRTMPGLQDDERCCSKSCATKRAQRLGYLRTYSDEQLLEILRERARGEYAPSSKLMRSPTTATYRTRFGSWAKAVAAAGLLLFGQRPSLRSKSAPRKSRRSLGLRFRILQRDKFTCQYCGGTADRGYILHVDHKIPRSKGGTDSADNLVTACEPCNLGKGMTLLVEI